MVQIYIDYDVLVKDRTYNSSLCSALDKLEKQGKCQMFVLCPLGNDADKEYAGMFKHSVIFNDFEYLRQLPVITKDITYISCDSEKLYEWYELKGKPILSAGHPMKDKDFYFNRFSVKNESDIEILSKLKKFIHI